MNSVSNKRKSMKKFHCIGLLSLIAMQAIALEIPEKSIVAQKGTKVSFKDGDFFVERDGIKHETQMCFNAKELNNMDRAKLLAFLKNGYIQVKPHGSSYCLDTHQRLNGGWWISGFVGYWTVKLGAGAVVSLGINSLISKMRGGRSRRATSAFSDATSFAEAASSGISGIASYTASNVIENTINKIPGAQSASESAALVSVTSGAGAMAAVESAALWVGAVLTACPYIP
jgi:hypothetical protein